MAAVSTPQYGSYVRRHAIHDVISSARIGISNAVSRVWIRHNGALCQPAHGHRPARGISNVLSEEKKQQVIALGKLSWTLRRIEQATGGKPGSGRPKAPNWRKQTPGLLSMLDRRSKPRHAVTVNLVIRTRSRRSNDDFLL